MKQAWYYYKKAKYGIYTVAISFSEALKKSWKQFKQNNALPTWEEEFLPL
jgi:hypothetical protein